MIYLDNAATGYPKSGRVVKSVAKAMRACGNPGRSGHGLSVFASRKIYECRERLALFFDTEPERVILTPSATTALNMAIKGFAKNKIVTSNVEHNAVYRPLCSLEVSKKAEICFFDAMGTDDEIVSSFKSVIDGAFAAVFTHASNVFGRVLPVSRLVAEAKKQGVITIIDAAQSAGHIMVSVADFGADIVCVAGHKGLYGPLGTGAMLINKNFGQIGQTLLEGGAGLLSFEKTMPDSLPERFEPGTMNAPAFSGLAEAVRETSEAGFGERLEFKKLVEGLMSIKNITLYGLDTINEGEFLPVALFNIKDFDSESLASFLTRRGICVRGGFHCAPLAHNSLGTKNGGVRVSLGRKNTKRDIDVFLRETANIAKRAL